MHHDTTLWGTNIMTSLPSPLKTECKVVQRGDRWAVRYDLDSAYGKIVWLSRLYKWKWQATLKKWDTAERKSK